MGLVILTGCAPEVPIEGKVEMEPEWRNRCVELPEAAFQLCRVPPGTLRLGGENTSVVDRRVEVETFWLADTPVTNADYERFDPEHERADFSPFDDSPVTNVTWYEAQEYLAWLSQRLGFEVRLADSLEWEFACLGGTDGPYPWGTDTTRTKADIRELANVAGEHAEPVRGYPANAFGLYGMVGNVMEWASDWWFMDEKGVRVFPSVGSTRKHADELKVIKSCPATNYSFVFCECYHVLGDLPGLGNSITGVRVAASEVPAAVDF